MISYFKTTIKKLLSFIKKIKIQLNIELHKIKNLTKEQKKELIFEICLRILYHGSTFLIAFYIINIFLDYIDKNF